MAGHCNFLRAMQMSAELRAHATCTAHDWCTHCGMQRKGRQSSTCRIIPVPTRSCSSRAQGACISPFTDVDSDNQTKVACLLV